MIFRTCTCLFFLPISMTCSDRSVPQLVKTCENPPCLVPFSKKKKASPDRHPFFLTHSAPSDRRNKHLNKFLARLGSNSFVLASQLFSTWENGRFSTWANYCNSKRVLNLNFRHFGRIPLLFTISGDLWLRSATICPEGCERVGIRGDFGTLIFLGKNLTPCYQDAII